MTEKKRKQMVYAIFIGAVLFGLAMKPWERRRSRRVETPIAAATAQPSAPDVAAVAPIDAIAFAEAWPRDPFERPASPAPAPIVVAAVEDSHLRLQGIMTMRGEPVCVLNGMTRSLGATVKGWTITSIDAAAGTVTIAKGRRREELQLP